jgi:hypothetical protein
MMENYVKLQGQLERRAFILSREIVGRKQALIASRNLISAAPPSFVPKKVASERSRAAGSRWVALAFASWG